MLQRVSHSHQALDPGMGSTNRVAIWACHRRWPVPWPSWEYIIKRNWSPLVSAGPIWNLPTFCAIENTGCVTGQSPQSRIAFKALAFRPLAGTVRSCGSDLITRIYWRARSPRGTLPSEHRGCGTHRLVGRVHRCTDQRPQVTELPPRISPNR